ncbi:hypothetical protein [Paraburkholderia terrae]
MVHEAFFLRFGKRRRAVRFEVNLFLALGGGWEEEKNDSSASEKVGAKSE